MSALGNLIGDIGTLAGDEGKTSVTSLVKNRALQTEIDSGISDYGTIKKSGKSALSDYIAKYMAGEGAATTRTGQEIGNIDRYFSGGVENDLMRMRQARASAVRAAAARAGQYAIANSSRSRIGREGGPSSYDRRMLIRNMTDIDTQAALDDAMAERGDYDYLERSRLGLMGQRNRMADLQAGYGLVPENLRRSMYGQDLGYLGQLGQLDQMNKFYGVKYKPSTTEQVGSVVGDVANLALAYYSGGMMGGGPGSDTGSTAGSGGGGGGGNGGISWMPSGGGGNSWTGGGAGWQNYTGAWNPSLWNSQAAPTLPAAPDYSSYSSLWGNN